MTPAAPAGGSVYLLADLCTCWQFTSSTPRRWGKRTWNAGALLSAASLSRTKVTEFAMQLEEQRCGEMKEVLVVHSFESQMVDSAIA